MSLLLLEIILVVINWNLLKSKTLVEGRGRASSSICNALFGQYLNGALKEK